MNPELLKKLKDAGYKFRTSSYKGEIGPLLSELIEACGEKFMDLRKSRISNNGEWYACGAISPMATVCRRGDIPREAVANLLLELNKK